MKRMIVAIAAGLALGGCAVGGDDPPSGDPGDTVAPQPEVEKGVDVVSGEELAEFEGSPTYEWRVAISDDPDGLVEKMQAVAPQVDEDDLSSVLDICGALADGSSEAQVVEQAVDGFSDGPDDPVSAVQAQDLVEIARTDVCP